MPASASVGQENTRDHESLRAFTRVYMRLYAFTRVCERLHAFVCVCMRSRESASVYKSLQAFVCVHESLRAFTRVYMRLYAFTSALRASRSWLPLHPRLLPAQHQERHERKGCLRRLPWSPFLWNLAEPTRKSHFRGCNRRIPPKFVRAQARHRLSSGFFAYWHLYIMKSGVEVRDHGAAASREGGQTNLRSSLMHSSGSPGILCSHVNNCTVLVWRHVSLCRTILR